MLRIHDIFLPLDHDEEALAEAAAARLGVPRAALGAVTVARRAHDARKRSAITLVYAVDVALADEARVLRRLAHERTIGPTPDTRYRPLSHTGSGGARPTVTRPIATRPVVIGTGPCGLFAALILAEAGLRPIILERGKAVRERTKDTWGFWRRGELNPESNVQFGEGGAGTFSDGKLHSRIRDPSHRGRKVLTEFVAAGAPEEILWLAKPHVGTFRLVSMLERMRAKIEALGGEYRFGAKVADIIVEAGRGGARHLRGLMLEGGETIRTDRAVLAIGHSARDTFAMLARRGVAMEAKPFSIGIRIEHPQSVIDAARFGPHARHPRLGAADYALVHHTGGGRAVYSFCMCPGGTVVAAASEPGQVVTNGMSQYSRAERNANAGIVVGVTPADYGEGDGGEGDGGPAALAGIAFQRRWEVLAFAAGGGTYAAPAQRVADFLANRASASLGAVVPSYRPGVAPADLASCLPDFVTAAIREALGTFARRIDGFAMDDAVMTGVETRTSSPLRILRDDGCMSLDTPGLYPAGEGAGHAGGILSAGVDGIRAAEAVIRASLGEVPRHGEVARHGKG